MTDPLPRRIAAPEGRLAGRRQPYAPLRRSSDRWARIRPRAGPACRRSRDRTRRGQRPRTFREQGAIGRPVDVEISMRARPSPRSGRSRSRGASPSRLTEQAPRLGLLRDADRRAPRPRHRIDVTGNGTRGMTAGAPSRRATRLDGTGIRSMSISTAVPLRRDHRGDPRRGWRARCASR